MQKDNVRIIASKTVCEVFNKDLCTLTVLVIAAQCKP